jgi:putative sigma-54 modulation protein
MWYNKNAEREGKPERTVNTQKGGRIMNISIIARQVNVRDDLKALVEKKLAKFDRYFPRGADAAVTFRRIRDDECVELTISVGGTLFRAEETSAEFRTSLTRCVDVIEGQIRKNKTRLEKRMKSTFAAAEAAAAESTEAPVEEEGDFDIRVKSFPLKPMTPEEAILQMNLLGHAFYAFEDADSGETCVVYKRNAGSYGLIIPEKKAE